MTKTMDWVQIGRDSFGRFDLIRRLVATAATCTWCGARRKSGKLFEYGTWDDGGRVGWLKGLFCSKGCKDSYHDIHG